MAELVFLGGMGRSGTNLLRNILDSHPDVASGPEFNLVEDIIRLYRSLSLAVDQERISSYMNQARLRLLVKNFMAGIFEEYGDRLGKRLVVEKTPSNIWQFLELSHLFPTAKFIHVVRDGRDVCSSHREVGLRLKQQGLPLDAVKDSALLSIFHCAALWNETVQYGYQECGEESELYKAGKVITIKYEDLVIDPESVIRQICGYLGLSFNHQMLSPHLFPHDTFVDGAWVRPGDPTSAINMRSVGRWVKSMSIEDRALFAAKGQNGLITAGYETNASWTFAGVDILPETAKAAINSAKEKIEQFSIESSTGH
jgi:protein-tyrosine sulfotransferase